MLFFQQYHNGLIVVERIIVFSKYWAFTPNMGEASCVCFQLQICYQSTFFKPKIKKKNISFNLKIIFSPLLHFSVNPNRKLKRNFGERKRLVHCQQPLTKLKGEN